MDGWALVTEERQALVDLLRQLEPEDWRTPSLCPGWSALDVLAHMTSVLEAGPLDMARAAARGLGSPPRVTAQLARRWAARSPEQLLDGLQARVDSRFAPPGLGYRAPLTDVLVHALDIAVPLGLAVDRPPESWRPVLDFLTSRIPMFGSIRGHRPRLGWRTTDLDWAARAVAEAPQVRGPAAAVGLTLSGRGALLDELEGPGVDPVRAWLG